MLKYKLVKHKILAGVHKGQQRFYGRVKSGTHITFEKLCEQVSHMCTCNYSDVVAAVKEGLHRMCESLSEGYSVPMGRLGVFRLSASSEGTATEEEFTLHNMKKARVVFSPGVLLQRMIREVGFEKDNPKVVKRQEEEECRQPHKS